MTNDTTTPDEPMDGILTGETHLEPAYRPMWENNNPKWDDGQITLEGELDFPADQPAREVAASLRDRAEVIGAIVSHDTEAGEIRAYPWNGPGHFRLNYDPDDPEARVDSITVFDGQDRPASHETAEELESKGEFTATLKAALNSSNDSESEARQITIEDAISTSD